ncbi:MAG: hypothetical protein JO140_00815 [Candidatus Eremiobacteraeota bacterium]|nr:hypothetical protein [Candidatus Eremiobacteraeota bacterium]
MNVRAWIVAAWLGVSLALGALPAAAEDDASPVALARLSPAAGPIESVGVASRGVYVPLEGDELKTAAGGPTWIRLSLAGDAASGTRWYLRISKLRRATFYARGVDGWLEQRSGLEVPYATRSVPSVLPTFEIVSDTLARGDAFLRIDDRSAQIKVVLLTSDAFERADRSRLAFFGAFFGLLLAVGLYHLLMYVLLRNRELLAYALYVAALVAEELVRTGYAAAFIWPGIAPNYGLISSFTFAFLAWASFWFFTSFLAMREVAPRSYRIVGALTAVVVLITLLGGIVAGAAVLTGIQILSLLTLGAVFVVALDRVRRGDRAARYFIIAFSGVLGGAALYVVGGAFWFGSLVVDVGFEIGTAFEAIALALGLADRIKRANEERDLAQRRIIEETRSLNVAYARFVPREFLELLGKDDVRDVRLGEAVQREMTVLFSDIRSFTSLSEKMTPRENFEFINGYLERVGPIVRQHRGVIDKYIGDAIMALFPSGPDDALRCAIALQREVAAIAVERTAKAAPPIAVGVGLHTGALMLGTIGESERMDGTVIADAVNLASRMEGLTKTYRVGILLTDETRGRLADPSAYALRYLGRVAVKGKARGIGIYETCDAEPPARYEAKGRTREDFALGVARLGEGKFEEAAVAFDAVLAFDPADGAAAYLRERAHALHAAPASAEWDGVDHVTTK